MAGLLVVVGCVIAGFLASRPEKLAAAREQKPVASAPASLPAPESPAQKEVPAAAPTVAPPSTTPAAETLILESAPVMNNGYVVQDPLARIALNFVGEDDEATAYWLGAINDPSLPPEERKDLIEDLNETGLADPDHPNAQDMPLVVARLRLIEQFGPSAIDPVNGDAFGEAKKDLQNFANGIGPQ